MLTLEKPFTPRFTKPGSTTYVVRSAAHREALAMLDELDAGEGTCETCGLRGLLTTSLECRSCARSMLVYSFGNEWGTDDTQSFLNANVTRLMERLGWKDDHEHHRARAECAWLVNVARWAECGL